MNKKTFGGLAAAFTLGMGAGAIGRAGDPQKPWWSGDFQKTASGTVLLRAHDTTGNTCFHAQEVPKGSCFHTCLDELTKKDCK